MTDHTAQSKADDARKHSQIDESGAPVDISEATKTNPSDRTQSPASDFGRLQPDQPGRWKKEEL